MKVTTFDSSTRTWRVNLIDGDEEKYVVIARPGEREDDFDYNGIDIDLTDIDRIVAALIEAKKFAESEGE